MVKLLAVLLYAISVLAFNIMDSRTVLYNRTNVPEFSEWKIWKQAEQHQVVTFSLALKHQNLNVLEQMFWENSNPRSPQFAKHMTREEILKLIAPTEEVQTLLIDWIQHAAEEVDLKAKIKNMHDSIQVTAPVQLVNHLFRTNMHAFINTKTHDIVLKHLGSLSIPTDLASHIEMVTGITELPPPSSTNNKERQRNVESKPEGVYIDNACNVPYSIRNLYKVPEDLIVENPFANISIYAGFYPDEEKTEGFYVPDYTGFKIANNIPQKNITCILGNAAKHYDPDGYDIEAVLDIQLAEGMAPGANLCFYVMDSANGWMYEFVTDIFQTPNSPTVVSISYAWNEDGQCLTDADSVEGMSNCTALHIPNSQVYVQRTNVEFMKLGLAGFTVLVASGDDGTVGGHFSACKTMQPLYPPSSPYVTAVGATALLNTSIPTMSMADNLPPVCANGTNYRCVCSTSANEQPALIGNVARFDTGGGFSNFNAIPDYQTKAVNAYLKSGIVLPDASMWNSSGRAYPDVSAIGENICTIQEVLVGTYDCMLEGGTSASTPLWAGLIALLNQDRLNAGKTTLGFINPILYEMFSLSTTKYFNNGFTDGNNSGECPESMGFYANPGHWTPLTGLGSPKFDQIRKYVASLP